MKYCSKYCGVSCANGNCPAIEDLKVTCDKCWHYHGCEDCYFCGEDDECLFDEMCGVAHVF